MADEGFRRKLTAILSADVEGYSRLMGDNEEATVRTLTAYREVLSTLIQQHNGNVLDSPGDNLLAEFVSVVDAVQCAVAVQKEIKARNDELTESRRMQFRIGINLGDVIQEDERIYGDGVNIAARLEGLAEPGGICISKTAFDHIESKLPYGYEFLGDQTVKNIAKPVRAYRVLMEPRVTIAGEPKEEKPAILRRWPFLVGVAAVIMLVVAAGIWQLYMRRPSIEPASVEKMAFPMPDKPSIAVLPFTNMSEDPKQEYFADGMTEDLITDLSQISGLFVIARNSTFAYKGKSTKIRQVAEELGVRYILEGSVRRADDRVRVNTQLIDATTGHHLWAKRYDGKLGDIFDLQDKITQKIITALRVNLTPIKQDQVTRKGTDNIEAYDNFLQGWGHYLRQTETDFAKAASYFKRAIEFDPNYGQAYAALALIYYKDAKRNWVSLGVSKGEAWLRSLQYLQTAMKNPTSIAYQVASEMSLFNRLWLKASIEAKQAIDLDPNDANSLLQMGQVLIYSGKPKEAVEYLKRAMRLDPLYPAYPLLLLGEAHFNMEQYEEAVNFIKRAIKHNPDLVNEKSIYQGRGSIILAAAYGHLGRLEEAQDAGSKMVRPDFTRLIPFMYSKDAVRLANGLIKAGSSDPARDSQGLSDTRIYYKLFNENKLTGEEIRALVFGREVLMRTRGGWVDRAGFIRRSKDGEATYLDQWGRWADSGKSWIEGDMLCDQWEKSYEGQKICYAVFRNLDFAPGDPDKFLYLIDNMFRTGYFKPMD
jgi:TolB-like protein/class 3 adenylate cyclase/tetratricopeptide (TPR) repeat protein